MKFGGKRRGNITEISVCMHADWNTANSALGCFLKVENWDNVEDPEDHYNVELNDTEDEETGAKSDHVQEGEVI